MEEATNCMKHDHVRIAVTDGPTRGVEQVPARRLLNGDWELIRSPLYATQVAAGDVIRVLDSETGAFEIVTRGGNVGVQFFLSERDSNNAQATARLAIEIAAEVLPLGGRMDVQTAGLIVYSIPSKAGFMAIERIFEAAVNRHSGTQWQYCNVYDPKTGEPLRWWE